MTEIRKKIKKVFNFRLSVGFVDLLIILCLISIYIWTSDFEVKNKISEWNNPEKYYRKQIAQTEDLLKWEYEMHYDLKKESNKDEDDIDALIKGSEEDIEYAQTELDLWKSKLNFHLISKK